MNIDFEPTKVGLKQIGLKQVTNFYYNVGYCSFDAITYLLRYSNSSINFRFFFGLFWLNIGTLKKFNVTRMN
jgi:hypothetical protein